jgi:hypothetical protein
MFEVYVRKGVSYKYNGEAMKPRFRVDEPVYVRMNSYRVKGWVRNISTCIDHHDGTRREYFYYDVHDENGRQIQSDICALMTDNLLIERWEHERERRVED